ncbi:MAG: hypothetical protein WCD18_04295, partial [Thermosynechococcaceae cyanobacterium]
GLSKLVSSTQDLDRQVTAVRQQREAPSLETLLDPTAPLQRPTPVTVPADPLTVLAPLTKPSE